MLGGSNVPDGVGDEARGMPPAAGDGDSATPALGIALGGRNPPLFTLRIELGPATGSSLALHEGDEVLLGRRHPGFGGLGGDGALSSQHARLSVQHGVVVLEDLGSTNGTWINGAQIHGPTQVRDGDRISVGRSELVLSPVGGSVVPTPASAAYAPPPPSADAMSGAEKAVRSYIRFRVLLGAVGLAVMLLVVGGWFAYETFRDKTTTVPEVAGMSSVDAASTLYPLDVIHAWEPNDQVQWGNVVRTEPAAGTEVAEDSTVRVVLSCGVPVPGQPCG